ncbi:hypothetical protein LINGRAHAP2_LOCUS19570 [Linum grandiflorum]
MTYYCCKVVILMFVAGVVIMAGATDDGEVKSFGCNVKSKKIITGGNYEKDIKAVVEQLAECTDTGGQIGNCQVKVPTSKNPRITGHGQCTVSSRTKTNCQNCLKAAGRYLLSNCPFTEADVIYNHCSMSYNSRGL